MERAKIDEVMTTVADFSADVAGTLFIKEEAAKVIIAF